MCGDASGHFIMTIVKSEGSPAPESYGALLREIKERIRTAQYAVLRSVNLQLLSLYCGTSGG
jgi:hypothetical protein